MPHSESLSKIAAAARAWGRREDLAPGQRAMARTLEAAALEQAGLPRVAPADLDKIRLMTCHLATAANGGRKPDPESCPFGLCGAAECVARVP